MQTNGVLNYKTPELELTLSPAAIFPETKEALVKEADSDSQGTQWTSDDVLLWSAPGVE